MELKENRKNHGKVMEFYFKQMFGEIVEILKKPADK